MIQQVAATTHFLPPYAPEYNPIEEALSKVKAEMKAMEKEARVTDIQTIVLATFSCMTVNNCNQWILVTIMIGANVIFFKHIDKQ